MPSSRRPLRVLIPTTCLAAWLAAGPLTTSATPPPGSVLLLRSARGGACGTGALLSDGTLVTTAHLAATLCPGDVCDGVDVFGGTTPGKPPVRLAGFPALRVAASFGGLDVAFLKGKELALPAGGLDMTSSSAAPGAAVTAFGFPGCGLLEESRGTVTGTDGLRYETTARGSPGSSGSPLVSENGNLIGIIDGSVGLLGTVTHNVFGTRFALGAGRLDVAAGLFAHADPAASVAAEARLLSDYHRREVMTVASTARLFRAARFFELATAAEARALSLGAPGRVAAYLLTAHGRPRVLASPPATPAEEAAEELSLRVALEREGPYRETLVPLDRARVEREVEGSPRTRGHVARIRELLAAYPLSGYQGFELMRGAAATVWGLLAAVLFALYSASVGWVFGTASGTLARRLGISLAVALLAWPVSLVVYLGFLLRRGRPSRR